MTSKLIVNELAADTGISTITVGDNMSGVTFKTGTSNLHNVGIEIAGINVLGADTPIGAGATIYNSGDVIVGGAVTATTFVGNLTGNVTGNISGGTVAGSTGTFTGDVSIPDTIVHTGDTNTKIRFPANDTISFETGGVQRLQLDSTEAFFNSTGANTDFRVRSPAQGHLFFVDAGNDQVTIKTSSAQSGAVLTVNGRTHLEQLTLGNNSTLDGGAQATIYKPATNTLAFATAGANERLRIDSSGRVLVSDSNAVTGGFGTHNWQPKTQILETQGAAIVRIANSDAWGGALHLASANGTYSSPSATASGDIAGGVYFHAYDGSNFQNYVAGIEAIVADTVASNDTPGYLKFSTTADGTNVLSERLRITSDGILSWRSGLASALSGTGNPYSLNIYRDSGSGYGFLDCLTGSSNHTGWKMRVYHNGTYGNVIAHATSDYTWFETGGSERLRIDSNGNVSIHSGAYGGGGTAPQLYVRGTGGRQVKIHNSNAGTSSLQITNGTTGEGEDAGTQLFTQGSTGDFHIQNAFATGDIAFATKPSGGSTTERLRLGTNSNSSSIGSFGTTSSHLNNCTTPDRASFKVGGRLHLEGAFGHNAMTGLYYNCYSGGNDLFYSGTYTPSAGDGRAAAITMRYGGVAVFVDNSSTAYSPTNQITTMQNALSVDRNGIVKKPLQPSFHARRTNSANSTSNPLVFDSVHHNNGSHYKSSGTDQGKYVAPVAGVYLFYWTAIKTNNGSVCRLYINVNNSHIYSNMHLRLQEDGTYSNGSMQAILNLSSGDKVHISLEAGSIHGNEYTHFGGYLIG